MITPEVIFSLIKAPHRTTNPTVHIQAKILKSIPPALHKHIIFWVHDFLLHANSYRELLNALCMSFSMFAKVNLIPQPTKCILFTKSIPFFGRIISNNGISFHPHRFEFIPQMELPTSGSHQQQFVCAMQCMPISILQLSKTILPLLELLEILFERAGKRMKPVAASIKLS